MVLQHTNVGLAVGAGVAVLSFSHVYEYGTALYPSINIKIKRALIWYRTTPSQRELVIRLENDSSREGIPCMSRFLPEVDVGVPTKLISVGPKPGLELVYIWHSWFVDNRLGMEGSCNKDSNIFVHCNLQISLCYEFQ